ncbi:hypothetical protein F5878DRAFT_619867 [Lentinula raphanica]|uniref:Uncharacterized protein n=1 Tax=Lentinula raphanica TaxID=153919 RepID=A0AA38UE11_9AGAR|nr:hypothetical protein F5880DRAFT_1609982 [Lentinula raphanica]KAJ3838347.1 hypothetical protein F5878DRAFT_619867 [Lentinula raphanica]
MTRPSQVSVGETFSNARYLRREWKLFKPHLRLSDSLPDLALIPHGRPLFTCSNCNFANNLIDLCLWCPLHTADTRRMNPNLEYRRRRVSAPALLLCWQPPKIRPYRRRRATAQSSSVHVSAIYQNAHDKPMSPTNDTNPFDRDIGLLEGDVKILDAAVSHRQIVVTPASGDSVVTATLLPKAQSVILSSMLSRTMEHSMCRGSQLGASNSDCGGPSAEYPIHHETCGCQCSSNQPAEGSTSHHKDNGISPAPTPTLRRKKRYVVLHTSTPPSKSTSKWTVTSTRLRPQSQPTLSNIAASATTTRSSWLPITDMTRARNPPDLHQLHLGHPNRPYYTALRKNMSPPSSTFPSSGDGSRSSYLGASVPASLPLFPASFSDDSDEFSLADVSRFTPFNSTPRSSMNSGIPFAPFGLVLPSSSSTNPLSDNGKPSVFRFPSIRNKFRRNSESGISKADEMKLRLALAREVGSVPEMGADKDYFHEGRGLPNVKVHIRRLSRGLKEFVTMRRKS